MLKFLTANTAANSVGTKLSTVKMETSTNKRLKRFSTLQSNPQWIENLLSKLQAANESQTNVEESLNLVRSVVNILLSAVAKYDAKFSFQPVDSSSFFMGKTTNHFELLVFVSSQNLRPAEIIIRFQGDGKGFALIEMVEKTTTQRTWKTLCRKSKSGREYLSAKMLRCELSNLLSKLLADMLYLQHYHDKTMQGIEIRNISSEDTVCLEVKIRGLTFIVDLVTAIDCEGLWPVQDFSRKGQFFNPCKRVSSTQSKRNPVNCGIQLVSKATPLEYHWKIWFWKAERYELNFNRFPQRRKCFQLLKMFVYSELGCDFIKPYHLQTVLLHESAKFSDENQWTVDKLSDRFYGLVCLLECFVHGKSCPHFFIPSMNLLTGISSQNLRVLCQRIKFIKESYENFMDNKFPVEDRVFHSNTWL